MTDASLVHRFARLRAPETRSNRDTALLLTLARVRTRLWECWPLACACAAERLSVSLGQGPDRRSLKIAAGRCGNTPGPRKRAFPAPPPGPGRLPPRTPRPQTSLPRSHRLLLPARRYHAKLSLHPPGSCLPGSSSSASSAALPPLRSRSKQLHRCSTPGQRSPPLPPSPPSPPSPPRTFKEELHGRQVLPLFAPRAAGLLHVSPVVPLVLPPSTAPSLDVTSSDVTN